MSARRYVVRPKADQDLDEQAYYLAEEATPEAGHRFLVAAHETFSLLVTQPEMGWHCRLQHPGLATLRVFRVSEFERRLVLYWPIRRELKSFEESRVRETSRPSCVAKRSSEAFHYRQWKINADSQVNGIVLGRGFS